MVKLFTLSFFLCFSIAAFSQLPTIYGAQQVFGAATTLGRQVVQADQERKENARREEIESEYFNMVAAADTLYARRQYSEAIARYNDALRLKQEQYPKDQIAKANAEMARGRRDEYRLIVDQADSLFNEMAYDQAIARYNDASLIRRETYLTDQIAKANAARARWGKVHFSGLLISGQRIDEITSKAYSVDPYSDFVAPGNYPDLNDQLVYSGYQTIDGIAVPAGIRLVVYSEPLFSGKVLLDVTGPAIVNNVEKKGTEAGHNFRTEAFPSLLQQTFPASTRTWSASDMQKWIQGSIQITTL